MTAKELEADIKNGNFDEKKSKKMELVLDATKAITSSIRSTLVEKQILRENTEKFLKHKKFRDELLSAIFKILEHKDGAHHLRRSELDLLLDSNASIIQYKEVLNKINNGLILLISEEDENEFNYMLQEVLTNYIDNVHKSTLKKSL
ncbi:MAG: hypothetical protein J6Q13_02245 [Clostridia bacterium]|nr:hypothetical protein [Clostridia bacterium]